MKILENAFMAVLIAWIIIITWFSVDMFKDIPHQIRRDRLFINKEIKPYVSSIDSFENINKRLPSEKEFSDLKNLRTNELGNAIYMRSVKDADNEIKSEVKNLNWRKDYALAVWRGEWWEYYVSRNHKYITNNTELSDRYFIIIYWLFGCLIPITLFIWLKKKFKNKGV